MIDSTWPRPRIARNDYPLACTRPGRRKRKPDSRWALVLGVAVDESTGVIDCVTFERNFNETMRRFGGYVAKYLGDGVLVYFGYPQANEDDAEQAVRAGLELIQAVGGFKSAAPLQTRVGIATGLVVVGDLLGTVSAQEQAVVGETAGIVH